MEIWKDCLATQLDGFVVNEQMICFFINDGRSVSLATGLYPVLSQAGHDALRNCHTTADNLGLHWPELDVTINLFDHMTE